MQNSEYLALPIVCQRIYSDVLWHYMVLYSRTVWAWSSPPHPWSSLPWLLSRACYDIHMEGSVLLFLRFVWAVLPFFCLHSGRDSKPCAGLSIHGKVGSRGTVVSWPLCLQSRSLCEEDNPPHTMCVVRKPGGPSTSYDELSTGFLSVLRILCLSLFYLSSPLYAPHSSGVTANPRTCREGSLFCLV